MRDPRLTERRNPRTAAIDTAASLEIVDLMSAEDAAVPAAVHRAREPIARTIDLIEAAFRAGGRLFYVGAGTSGRLGVRDASECPPTFGSEPEMVQGIIAGGLPAILRRAGHTQKTRFVKASGLLNQRGANLQDLLSPTPTILQA